VRILRGSVQVAVVALAFSGAAALAQHHGQHAPGAPSGDNSGTAAHGGEAQGGEHRAHGEMVREAMDFPTIDYDERREARPPQRRQPPPMPGSPEIGKKLAFDRDKGRCLSCHVLAPDGEQAGNVGSNLSSYGDSGRDRAQTFQRVWDARVLNLSTVMPPFGTNGLLNEEEVAHVVAYLDSLRQPAEDPVHPARRARRDRVFIADDDLSNADVHLDHGRAAFAQPGKNGKSCVSCHRSGDKRATGLEGAAAIYPRFDAAAGRVIGLEDRINACLVKHMDGGPMDRESHELNLLTSYVKFLSRGAPISVAIDGPAAHAIERGRRSFARKAGQLEFSCASCHTALAGQWLRGQRLRPLSDVAGDWPKHFIAEHELGLISLQQRIRHCQIVTRTQPLALGSREYTELELYLTSLANGTPVWAPTNSRLRGQ
jgi:sulfur-oxidizing protein SoxA